MTPRRLRAAVAAAFTATALVGTSLVVVPTAGAAGPAATGIVAHRNDGAHRPAPPRWRNTCSPTKAALPAAVAGPSAFKAGTKGGQEGLYVYHDARGWHLRATHATTLATPTRDGRTRYAKVVFGGQVTASRPIVSVHKVKLESRQGDWVSVQRPRRASMEFRFVNVGGVDGVDFKAGCAGKVTFTAWKTTTTTSASGRVTRTRVPVPVFVGSSATPMELSTSASANPSLVQVRSRVWERTVGTAAQLTVLRTPPIA